jgi:queuine/archaeosine tRNA-ribosyltransferase
VARAALRADPGPIDPACGCHTCSRYSRAYVNHLFRAGEPLGARLLSLHNVAYLVELLRTYREAIIANGDASRGEAGGQQRPAEGRRAQATGAHATRAVNPAEDFTESHRNSVTPRNG